MTIEIWNAFHFRNVPSFQEMSANKIERGERNKQPAEKTLNTHANPTQARARRFNSPGIALKVVQGVVHRLRVLSVDETKTTTQTVA